MTLNNAFSHSSLFWRAAQKHLFLGLLSSILLSNISLPSYGLTLDKVQSFEYLLGNPIGDPGVQSAIGNSSSDLVITGFQLNLPPLNREIADPHHSKIITGAISVSEASPGSTPSLFVKGKIPSWIGKENPNFPGDYSVQYWNPAWRPILYGQIDKVIAAGFDGIFLDVITGDTEWLPGNNFGNPPEPNATKYMVSLISDIRKYVSNKNIGRPFYLIGNNPTAFALQYPGALLNLDGIFSETIGNGGAEFVSQIAPIYDATKLPVFGNDYPPLKNRQADFNSFAFYSSLGWVPSVTTPIQTDAIFSTGPFMAMAVPGRQIIKGAVGLVNYLSGGLVPSATLTGGDGDNYFIGGPGRNVINGGGGNNWIYAHPANAALKNRLELQFINGSTNATHYPSVRVIVNGTVAVPSLLITHSVFDKNPQVQTVIIDTLKYGKLRSLEVDGLNIYYIDSAHFTNVSIQSLSLQGQSISFNLGTYNQGAQSLNNGTVALLDQDGTVKFSASAFEGPSPFPADTSSTIVGGGGTNTVIYRAQQNNYKITSNSDGSVLVTSKGGTAEGPDTLRNIQILKFTDKTVTLPTAAMTGRAAPAN